LEQEILFPPKALRDGVQGQVGLSFTVDAQGRATDIKLVQGLRADVDSAVLRNAHRLDAIRWQPGTQNGRPVGVLMTVPMSFRASSGNLAGSSPDSLDALRFHKARLPLSLRSLRHPVPSRKGVIYGSCVPRLGFNSGGRGQYVRVVNLATGEVFRLPVKPAFHLQREDAFYFELPSGRYALLDYELTQPPERLVRRPAGPGQSVAATRYAFTVEAGQLHYVGTWNLAKAHEPLFLDEKATLDALLQPESQALHFDTARRAIPQ
jgi:TonB family protein